MLSMEGLPQKARCFVDERKITDYLLNTGKLAPRLITAYPILR